MNRTLAIGDIHGGLKALQEVLEKAAVQKNDTLIFLGDYVDGWSQSAQVIDALIALGKELNCVFIKGNHDDWCQAWLRNKEADSTWLFNGGKSTIESYAGYTYEQRLRHLNFFETMKGYYVDAQNRLYIHAGFTSMHGPEKETHTSNFYWDRTLWEMALSMNSSLEKDSALFPKRLRHFTEIYIGHTPTLYYGITTPMNGCNVWNIDTGAAFTGSLTIMDVDTKQYWQSQPVQQLYPDEKGRNR
jgi:serine/threonine protein phosphatase 1